jgi:hypothetical protein
MTYGRTWLCSRWQVDRTWMVAVSGFISELLVGEVGCASSRVVCLRPLLPAVIAAGHTGRLPLRDRTDYARLFDLRYAADCRSSNAEVESPRRAAVPQALDARSGRPVPAGDRRLSCSKPGAL